jgi:hypothetical protein
LGLKQLFRVGLIHLLRANRPGHVYDDMPYIVDLLFRLEAIERLSEPYFTHGTP